MTELAENIQALETQMDGGQDTSIAVSSGSPSFDDFDSMDAAREQYVSSKTKSAQELAKQLEGEEEGEEDGQVHSAEAHEERTEQDKNVDPTMAPNPDLADVKLLKAMDGDTPFDLNPEAMIPVPVDGEVQNVSVQELRNNFSGKVAWDKRFTELDKRGKEVDQVRTTANKQMEVFQNVVKMLQDEADPVQGLSYALDIAGVQSRPFLEKLVSKMYGDVNELADMTHEERQQHFLIKENEFLRKRDETSLTRQKRQQSVSRREVELTQARKTRGLSEQEYVEGYNWIIENGQLPADQITADRIGETSLDLKAIGVVNEVLGNINKDLLTDTEAYQETFKYVRDKAVGPGATHTNADVEKLIRETLGMQAGKAVEERSPAPKPKLTEQVRPEDNENYGSGMFDDFDGEYHHGSAQGRNVL